MSAATSERLVLTTPRHRLALAGAGCAAALALGLWFLSQNEDPIIELWSWLGVILLGLGVVAAVVQLRRPPQLILTPEGFTLTGLVATGLIRWSDVATFLVYEEEPDRDGEGGVPAHAAWRLTERSGTRDQLVARLNRLGDLPIDGSLPRNIGLAPDALVQLMENWRTRYG